MPKPKGNIVNNEDSEPMDAIKIAWEKEVTARISGDIRLSARPEDLARIVAKAESHCHRCYRLSEDVLLEIPAATFRHGDVLVYLPDPGWLVRRNYCDYWYVDVGVLRPIGAGLYCWTDLWLDVTLNEDGSQYLVRDADELAEAVRTDAVAKELLVRGLDSFHRLMHAIRNRTFPSEQILHAEAKAMILRKQAYLCRE